jgi:hypothetical protein
MDNVIGNPMLRGMELHTMPLVCDMIANGPEAD